MTLMVTFISGNNGAAVLLDYCCSIDASINRREELMEATSVGLTSL